MCNIGTRVAHTIMGKSLTSFWWEPGPPVSPVGCATVFRHRGHQWIDEPAKDHRWGSHGPRNEPGSPRHSLWVAAFCQALHFQSKSVSVKITGQFSVFISCMHSWKMCKLAIFAIRVEQINKWVHTQEVTAPESAPKTASGFCTQSVKSNVSDARVPF